MSPSRQEEARHYKARASAVYETVCDLSVRRALNALDAPLSADSLAAVREANVAGQEDPYGDGDQSPVPKPSLSGRAAKAAAQALRSAWSTGLDVYEAVQSGEASESELHMACFVGNERAVRELIEAARISDLSTEEENEHRSRQPSRLTRLVERRISLLRLSPIAYACQGARALDQFTPADPERATSSMRYREVVDALISAGARVDARDICGYTPLGIAAGFGATERSLQLVQPLIDAGANVNVKTRFGEGLLVPTIMSNNVPAFKALIAAGADVMLADNTGLTPRMMACRVPSLMQAMTEAQRIKIINQTSCAMCGVLSASKHCGACKKVYYCSRECQKQHWRIAHKEACGKIVTDGGGFLDIHVGSMCTDQPVPGIDLPVVQFTNNITGVTSKEKMSPKHVGSCFVVKVSLPIEHESKIGSVKVNEKNSDFLLIKSSGAGKSAHRLLTELIKTKGIDVGKIYLSAKWLPANISDMRSTMPQMQEDSNIAPASCSPAWDESGSSASAPSNVLRLYISTPLPPPMPLW